MQQYRPTKYGGQRHFSLAAFLPGNVFWKCIFKRCPNCLSSLHLDIDPGDRVAADDNPMKLMSIAMRPLSRPPFPLERIEEMTALMGGDGCLYNTK